MTLFNNDNHKNNNNNNNNSCFQERTVPVHADRDASAVHWTVDRDAALSHARSAGNGNFSVFLVTAPNVEG